MCGGVDAEYQHPRNILGDVDPAFAVFDLRDIRLRLFEPRGEIDLSDSGVLAGGDHQRDEPDIDGIVDRAPGAGSSGGRAGHRTRR